ncbi:MAG: NAD(+) synthase [Deltaproteobacteria bacterium]|nr:NAD(+) synthase [Deltaproteobacteria bacterium]
MKILTVAAASLNQTPLDWNNNVNNIVTTINEAKASSVQVLCFPELSISGYGCEDAFLSPYLPAQAASSLEIIKDHCSNMVVAVGLPVLFQNSLYNCAALISDKKVAGIVAKQFLAGDGIHYEPRWFKPWPAGEHSTVDLFGEEIPFGDIFFEIDGIKIGFEICEDAWVAKRPGINLAQNGIDIILNPSASHFSFDKHLTREAFVVDGSRAFSSTYIYANLQGNEAGRIVYDGGSMIASAGQMTASGKRFSFKDYNLLIADADIEHSRMHQTQNTNHAITTKSSRIVKAKANFNTTPSVCRKTSYLPKEPMKKEEEFAKAVALGLFDYMRKSRSKGFVLSISGGADSAAVAVLIRIMVDLALKELGIEGFKQKLSYIEFDSPLATDITGKLLTTVYQSTKNSGDITRSAAGAVAREIGAQFLMWDVDELVTNYTKMIESSLQRNLTWERDDIALQNIQARVRAPGVWMMANVNNALLLSTSNRSEAAVGYATMDGDTSGGLSPIAGIDKAYLLTWLKIMEVDGIKETGNFPVLNSITSQQPTAELRPNESKQTDESDLMPYPVLDRIEKMAIRDRKGPVTVYKQLASEMNENKETIKHWVTRFYTLWSRNQWKRERYAPSFHLDDQNLDPKTWCRFPILSGGFKKELKELKDL